MAAAEERHVPPLHFSQAIVRGQRLGFVLHEPAAYQGKHWFVWWSHLLAHSSGNFLLDAARNNKVTQKSK